MTLGMYPALTKLFISAGVMWAMKYTIPKINTNDMDMMMPLSILRFLLPGFVLV